MTFRAYILKYASETRGGSFYCQICKAWIPRARWPHFKRLHRFKNPDV